MEHRQLGQSGLKVPVLSLGTATFGGGNEFFKAWGSTQVAEAKRLVDICLDAGLNFFDTANGYSSGQSEEILGHALEGRRQQVLLSTKCTFPTGTGDNDYGSSRHHILKSLDESLKRLRTDYVDIYHMHGFDGNTPMEETLKTLDTLVSSGRIRYIACSNFSGWQVMKAAAVAEKYGLTKYVAHQAYYSLVGRELEWELMPACMDQGLGTIVWSPLAGGALTGKIRRNKPAPKDSRIGSIDFVPFDSNRLFDVVDALDEVAQETGKTIAQVALNWTLQRPTVANVIVGARNEEQLKQNLGALGWKLTIEQMKKLNQISAPKKIYPYWHQTGFPQLNPQMIPAF